MLKILQANIDNKNRGGAYVLIQNLEKYMPQNEILFYYLSMDEFVNNNEIKLTKTFSAKLRKNRLVGHLLLPFYVKKILEDNKFDAIHINSDSSWKALLYALPAKKCGIKVIIHSHSTGIDGGFNRFKQTIHRIFRKTITELSDIKIACSNEAAEWMFTNLDSCKILFNGIDIEKYKFNEEIRQEQRELLGINDKFVLGNVGMVSATKNQMFLLDITKELKNRGIPVATLLVGNCDNKWRRIIKIKIDELNIKEEIFLLGYKNEIGQLLNAMDVFVLPSKFEGFSISLVEAQATGLPCLISDTIPDISSVSTWVKKESLGKSEKKEAVKWANMLLKMEKEYKKGRVSREIKSKYNIKNSAEFLYQIYRDYLVG